VQYAKAIMNPIITRNPDIINVAFKYIPVAHVAADVSRVV